MKNPCEDYGYEMQRQERIDAMEAGMPRKQKQLISADMIGSDRLPQKYERTDPWRNIPWAHYGPQPLSVWQKVGYAMIWLVVVGVLVWTEVMK